MTSEPGLRPRSVAARLGSARSAANDTTSTARTASGVREAVFASGSKQRRLSWVFWVFFIFWSRLYVARYSLFPFAEALPDASQSDSASSGVFSWERYAF